MVVNLPNQRSQNTNLPISLPLSNHHKPSNIENGLYVTCHKAVNWPQSCVNNPTQRCSVNGKLPPAPTVNSDVLQESNLRRLLL